MKFTLTKKNKIRLGKLELNHGVVETPIFMPVGTVGSVKGISPEELEQMGAQIILGNTYHLYLRPGDQFIKSAGGLHKFENWKHPILTDSGGYQTFSLGIDKYQPKSKFENSEMIENGDKKPTLAKITEDGVLFKSHIDGSEHFFTPEKVIDMQLNFGSDIIMPLDYCPSAEASRSEIEKAVDVTNKWFARAHKYFKTKTKSIKNPPALFTIVQGGTHQDLREKSFKFLSKFDVDGWAIGGVANAGESKLKQKTALQAVIPLLPANKPRYLMGVGEPEDLIMAIQEGIDMFDCVLPTRLGRHGTVWVKTGLKQYLKIDLRKSTYQKILKPIDKNCGCYACKNNFTQAYISHLIREHEILGIRLATMHNLWTILDLAKQYRQI